MHCSKSKAGKLGADCALRLYPTYAVLWDRSCRTAITILKRTRRTERRWTDGGYRGVPQLSRGAGSREVPVGSGPQRRAAQCRVLPPRCAELSISLCLPSSPLLPRWFLKHGCNRLIFPSNPALGEGGGRGGPVKQRPNTLQAPLWCNPGLSQAPLGHGLANVVTAGQQQLTHARMSH